MSALLSIYRRMLAICGGKFYLNQELRNANIKSQKIAARKIKKWEEESIIRKKTKEGGRIRNRRRKKKEQYRGERRRAWFASLGTTPVPARLPLPLHLTRPQFDPKNDPLVGPSGRAFIRNTFHFPNRLSAKKQGPATSFKKTSHVEMNRLRTHFDSFFRNRRKIK